MKYSRIRNLSDEKNGASAGVSLNAKNAKDAKKGNRSYKIVAAILAVFAIHFVWQFSFVERENLRITEDAMNSARLAVVPVETQPIEKAAEIKPDLAIKKTAVEETVKSVVPVKYSPSENNRPPVEVKKKAAREPRTERLRRAEKLLTGF